MLLEVTVCHIQVINTQVIKMFQLLFYDFYLNILTDFNGLQ